MALDPGNIDARVGAAWVDVRTGNSYTTDDRAACFAAAEAALTQTLSLAPEHAMAHQVLGLNPPISTNRAALAAALAHLGRLDEARSAVQAGLALDPTFTISRFRARASSDNPTSSDSARAHPRRDAQGRAAGGMSAAHRLAAILAVRDSVSRHASL